MYNAYFEVPRAPYAKDSRGSSPSLLRNLMNELAGAERVWASFFLYNNPHLHAFFKQLAASGTPVTIITIPLGGYSSCPTKVQGYRSERSKLDFAQTVYSDPGKVDFRLFPHTYVWKLNQVKRGNDVYSLHAKCLYAQFPGGKSKCFLTSSNFALADPSHSENMLVATDEPDVTEAYSKYFDSLTLNSLRLEDYEQFIIDNKFDAYYRMSRVVDWLEPQHAWFTGPWIRYGGAGSNHFARKRIINFILQSQKRIIVCAQHLNDYSPFGNTGVLSIAEALRMVALEKGIPIRVLTQTTAAQQELGRRAKEAQTFLDGLQTLEQRYWHPIVHDKFLIVDDAVIVLTANLTSTPFAWDGDREMHYEADGLVFSVPNQVFSEVNAFQVVNDAQIAEQYEQHFDTLWVNAKSV
ncbi:phospholipase D-like domain-containing protein [Paenibacillus sp. MAH-36]|uniref:Phospholipase D-like domain-containing protein n=1 Tax=Paenibacillus violae TaxID=3077234 RepID=A0ABU3RNG0_9BACL|nr:phospholipase D-like domain-containing protein [Paenibacillus sp. PFR10]MDU0205811.1 phospholipase D-like domain-containing protein [Paenibacillus sp. PFR10]